MRKCAFFSSCSCILGLLLLASPAFAVSFSGSALLEWDKLTFSGISVSIFPGGQFIHTAVDGGGLVNHDVQESKSCCRWLNETVTARVPQLGTAIGIFNSSHIFAAANLSEAGGANSQIFRYGDIIANETGSLTISIPYTLTLSGAQVLPGFPYETVGLPGIGDLDSVRLDAGSGVSLRTGTLSVTSFLNAGESGHIQFLEQIFGFAGSVDGPETFWPTLIGMIGVALYVEWRRRKLVS